MRSRSRVTTILMSALLMMVGLVVASVPPATAAPARPAAAGWTVPASANPDKINVLGEWAHPDDDTSIIGPCAVWHQRYGVKCGIIQVTRGEGGGNAIGPEIGPSLGLRRENEDRAAHYRSDTIDLYYLDKVDFYYNQSAPLTEQFWNHDDTLRRVTRIIRQTQPDIYVGFTPTLAAGHGNHQQAGRLIWEGVQAAADPTMFPDQLTGPDAVHTWQVKKIVSGGSTAGSGGTTSAPDCTTGFVPAATNLDTVAGVWNGYNSPYPWPAGNLQGVAAGTPKSWAQVTAEGRLAYPTQSRTQYQQIAAPACNRFGVTQSVVPFQPNLDADGSPNPNAGLDNALLFGAAVPDPGGLPLGTQMSLSFGRFFAVAGQPEAVTLRLRSGSGTLRAGRISLSVPDGWTVDGPARIGAVGTGEATTATFTVIPAAGAATGNHRIAARYTTGTRTGYTDNVLQIVPPTEGRTKRTGTFAEYDQWVTRTAPSALRLGRSAAVQSIGAGETRTVTVGVHNWSDTTQSGAVSLGLPAGFRADAASKRYASLAAGKDTSVSFRVTNTDPSLPTSRSYPVAVRTSYSSPSGSASESLSLDLVPSTTFSHAATAPTLDGREGSGEYTGPAIDLSTVWQGDACQPAGTDCGTAAGAKPGDANSTYARAAWNGDNLFFFIHVRDDTQSYAATPAQCVAHWLTDSVEIQLDPRGNSSDPGLDTSTTFKTGIFPFTDDPTNTLGNRTANGPCWERDADNHQGYANGPLAKTVPKAPNAPGMQVVSSANWVGTNDSGTSHAYAGGFYNLEVKIPMADLPAAVGPTSTPPTGSTSADVVDPAHLGFNITPYDEDNQQHIDLSTRLGWSAWNSVQSDPYHWGHAYLPGYTPPAGRSTTPSDPVFPDTALEGVDSPQTIWQSATGGVPIAGAQPIPAAQRLSVTRTTLSGNAASLTVRAGTTGRAHVFLWSGPHSPVPVYTSSCTSDPYEQGFTPCAPSDGGSPPWGTNLGGRVIADRVVDVSTRTRTVTIPLTAAQVRAVRDGGQAIVSFETDPRRVGTATQRELQALAMPLGCDTVVTGRHRGDLRVNGGSTCLAGGTVTGSVAISGNGSFAAVGGTVAGSISASGGRDVSVTGTDVRGSITLRRSVGTVRVDGAVVGGSVGVIGAVGDTAPVVADNRITRALGCTANDPAPVDERRINVVHRGRSGQCSAL